MAESKPCIERVSCVATELKRCVKIEKRMPAFTYVFPIFAALKTSRRMVQKIWVGD
jgi:hypothetical protein